MFDDRLFDIIMEEMMTQFGPEVRTDEGSLAYNACAKIAQKLEEVYGDMSIISDNMLPSTMDDIHLINYGTERGVPYSYATAPVVKATFSQEIEIGERFSCNDYSYEVTEKIENYKYKMLCDTEGVEANNNLGSLTPIDYVDDYQGGTITEVIIPGTDDEDIEEYREKVIATFFSSSFGGNKADYKKFVNSIEGVGGCKPVRRTSTSEYVNIYVISSTYKTPSSNLINTIQSAVDPEENSGEGDGMAPICHKVKIYGTVSHEVNVSATITFDDGYGIETSQSLIEAAVKGYLDGLCEQWESKNFDDTIVRVSQVEAKILEVEGVIDIADTKVNESASNLVLDFTEIPEIGEVVINV